MFVRFVSMNMSEGWIENSLWKKIGKLYQCKTLINKVVLKKKLYSIKIREKKGKKKIGDKQSKGKDKSKSPGKSKVKCWNCGKKGHIRRITSPRRRMIILIGSLTMINIVVMHLFLQMSLVMIPSSLIQVLLII